MELCVGAGSRLVVEEAAKLGVPQIVASRRQVNENRGYIGLDQYELVELVKELSGGRTQVVRDHGGPYQGGDGDTDWVKAFDIDVDAGFDGLHIDVCKLPRDEQPAELEQLVKRYSGRIDIEIGGERDEQDWLNALMQVALMHCQPTYVVMDVGGHIHADRQQGSPRPVEWVAEHVEVYHKYGVKAKAHNADWLGDRRRYEGVLDALNIAPEFGNVEVDAWLHALNFVDADALLSYGYSSRAWTRWFAEDEGTTFEKARCALRYLMNDRRVLGILAPYRREYEPVVRGRIADALRTG